MSGAYIAGRVAAVLRDHGEAMTLRRQTASSPQTFTDVTVYGKRFEKRMLPADGSPGEGQIFLVVKISNAEIAAAAWSGPPKKGDRLVIAGKTYMLEADADTRYDSGSIVEHILLVKG